MNREPYVAATTRYASMTYLRCGRSGLKLPRLALGLWHNFSDLDDYENSLKIVTSAFDRGITHIDLANNYGPPPGSAEQTFGRILREQMRPYRDELIISTKAGYLMWPGPYGDWGSRKYLLASLDQSLQRMGLDYVDIFYSHRRDPETPLEETMAALAHAVRVGKALYVGLSNYSAEDTLVACQILEDLGAPCLIHQPKYSLLTREPESQLLHALETMGVGCIVFSPLGQGLLTDRYAEGIPDSSRAAKSHGFLQKDQVDADTLDRVKKLSELAKQRGQTTAQLALSWVLRNQQVTTALVGVSSLKQLEQNLGCLEKLTFTDEELQAIDTWFPAP